MKLPVYLLLTTLSLQLINAQTRSFKCERIYDAIKLMDTGKYDESIEILRECEKIDPKDYSYPYEIAYAFFQKKDYKNAISQLEKIKNYENIKADYFQLLGNVYDYDGNPDKAIHTYEEGLKKFPNSGRLYLEKGVMNEHDKPLEAIKMYEKGIALDPSYPSNYYRAAKLYLNSNDKLSGLIYGEIFLNLERTTPRTQEMGKLLYEGYKKSIIFESKDKIKIDFCEAVIDVQNKKYPLCVVFGKNFISVIINQNEFNFENLAAIRNRFVKEYFKEDYKDYPNILFSYFKKMEDNNVLNAYNHYIFQMGDVQAFKLWQANNQAEYDKFADWYTTKENVIKIDRANAFISDQIK
ncbi:tetratricopeptide repeat protein [Chryseobacterium gossypii]|uniref:tetratricopeptide repeat protein n=1 Tax=Chryseobacterium gossypii TaxID=3231602 RepID=UPI0035268611